MVFRLCLFLSCVIMATDPPPSHPPPHPALARTRARTGDVFVQASLLAVTFVVVVSLPIIAWPMRRSIDMLLFRTPKNGRPPYAIAGECVSSQQRLPSRSRMLLQFYVTPPPPNRNRNLNGPRPCRWWRLALEGIAIVWLVFLVGYLIPDLKVRFT